jgi:hypothetical protein
MKEGGQCHTITRQEELEAMLEAQWEAELKAKTEAIRKKYPIVPRLAGRKDHRKTLRGRIELVSKTQPEILELRDKLLEIGGEELVAIPPEIGMDPFVLLFAKEGKAMSHPIRLRRMEPSQCHANVEKLIHQKKIAAMATGYALSEDGLWRSHSWGLTQKRDGLVIIETTVAREIYFGVAFPAKVIRENFPGIFGRACDPKAYSIIKSSLGL